MTEEVYHIEDHIYQDLIDVVFTDDINQSIREQCKVKNISTKDLIGGDMSACVCCIDRKNKTTGQRVYGTWALFDVNKTTPDIIVHECVHLARTLAHKRGLWFTEETEEAYAYLIQWLFNKINGYYNDYKNSLVASTEKPKKKKKV
jgi:hypothetical protein